MTDFDGGLDGHLAQGTHINGTLKFKRAVQIDGRFEGNVKSPGKLILGASAEVDAEIEVGELEVQGTLRGKVNAKERMLIRDGGVVEANILGASAEVDAEIEVGELEVQGTLRGKVNAKERMLIRDGGVVEANIVTGRLAIETGAIFRGHCEMPEPENLAKAASEPDQVPSSKPAPPKREPSRVGGPSVPAAAKSSGKA